MGSFGFTEIVIILAVGFLLFGAKRLPEMGRSVGKALREFKRSVSGEDSDSKDDDKKDKEKDA